MPPKPTRAAPLSSSASNLLVFRRIRDLRPERELSPERRNRMTLEPKMVSTIIAEGRLVWPVRH
jgi:hypothetical protein